MTKAPILTKFSQKQGDTKTSITQGLRTDFGNQLEQ